MLNSRKKKILNKTKNHTPPPPPPFQVKWSVPYRSIPITVAVDDEI